MFAFGLTVFHFQTKVQPDKLLDFKSEQRKLPNRGLVYIYFGDFGVAAGDLFPKVLGGYKNDSGKQLKKLKY